MRRTSSTFLSLLLLITIRAVLAQTLYDWTNLSSFSSTDWIQTNGPTGGFISTIAIDPLNHLVLYAVGPREGIYKSLDGGAIWRLITFEKPANERPQNLALSPRNPSTLYCSSPNDLLKSEDGGESWHDIFAGIAECRRLARAMVMDPQEDVLYVGTGVHLGEQCQGVGGTIYMTNNGGAGWTDIGSRLVVPEHAYVDLIGLLGGGKILAGINDRELLVWHRGKVFYSENNGQNWSEVNYGATEDRFIWSIYVNPFSAGEVWITEGPLYNNPIDQPFIYRSGDSGISWQPVFLSGQFDVTQIRVIGSSADGRVYIAAGRNILVTGDRGKSFKNIEPEADEMTATDFKSLAILPDNPDVLYLPLRSGGIGFSNNGGTVWSLRNNGILSSQVNLLAPDPVNPQVVYAASSGGEGTFRSDDYGENWIRLNTGGIVHPWGDELVVDPGNPDHVWFVGDVPYIHKSTDRGSHWSVLNQPYTGGNFNFCSVYAFAQSSDPSVIYALNNGFGLFKGWQKPGYWEWKFLNLSEVDYTYSLAVEPHNTDVIYSGYSRKPFEKKAKVMASYDGGEQWFTALEVNGAEAVTSVAIDPTDPNQVYAASTGKEGGALWKSSDKGKSWSRLNDYFNFTTIHSFAVPGGGSPTAYAGVWGGGIYITSDFGENWKKLEAEAAFSAAAITVDPADPQTIYLADRTAPVLYRSSDNGENWSVVFNTGPGYRRLMSITPDPSTRDRLYVPAMSAAGLGQFGGLFKIDRGAVTDITGKLPKLVLSLAVDSRNPSNLYTVLHESGVYKSVNGGNDWLEISGTSSGLPNSGFTVLYIDPNDFNTLYLIGGSDVRFETVESAGLDPDLVNGVYRSRNGGQTWENINRGILGRRSGAIKSLVFYQNRSDIIYLGAENGVFYTTDSGNNWTASPALPYPTLGGIAVSGSVIYAFTNGAGLFKGTINGDFSILWDSRQLISAPIFFAQILKDPNHPEIIYTSGYPGGIFKSADGGISWHEKNFGMPSFKVEDPLRQGYYALQISQSNADILYLGLYRKGIYRSKNGASTWYPVNGQNREMGDKSITSLAVSPFNPDLVFVAAEEGVFQSTDGGQTWTPRNQGLPTTEIRTLYFNSSGELYAGSKGYGLYRWGQNVWEALNSFGNFGVIWPMWNSRPLYQYTSLLIHPQDNSKMLLGTFPQGIYRSLDGGGTWKESNIGWTNDGVFYLVCHPQNPEIVYAGTYNGINRSLDFGKHWELWANGWPGEQWVFSIDFDPENSDIMYACSKNGGNKGTGREGFHGTVMKSTNGGALWFEITRGLDINQEFYNIVVDHFDNQKLYLATQNEGVYLSTDGGGEWKRWNEGLTNLLAGTNGNNVTNNLVLSADHSVLYFGSMGSGVFRRTITPVLPVNHLSASLHQRQVTLQWQFDDINDNFSHFNIYRSTGSFSRLEKMSPYGSVYSAAVTSFEDINVIAGVKYYYAITTTDKSGYENNHFMVLGPVVLTGDEPSNQPGEDCDFSGDGTVSLGDVIIFLLMARDDPQNPRLDWNKDGLYNITDVVALLSEVLKGTCRKSQTMLTSSSAYSKKPVTLKLSKSDIQYLERMLDLMKLPAEEEAALKSVIYGASGKPKLPESFTLAQNEPNPFNPSTSIRYDIPAGRTVHVSLNVYDLQGRLIRTLVNSEREPGTYNVFWDGTDYGGHRAASGIYLYRLRAGNFIRTRKMVLLK